MDQPSRDMHKVRSSHGHRSQGVWTLLAVSAVLSIVGWSSAGLEEDVVLVTRSPTLEAFLLSHFYYPQNLSPAWLAFGILGRLFESRWGTSRFVVFYFFTAWGSSLVTLVCGINLDDAYRSSGALSVVLGLLVAAGTQFSQHQFSPRSPPLKHLIWAVIFLLGAAMAYLPGSSGYLLLPQVSGVPLCLVFLWLDPIYQRWQASRRVARIEQERKRVQDIRLRVDGLLEKISSAGYASLTRDEQLFLRHASEHFKAE